MKNIALVGNYVAVKEWMSLNPVPAETRYIHVDSMAPLHGLEFDEIRAIGFDGVVSPRKLAILNLCYAMMRPSA